MKPPVALPYFPIEFIGIISIGVLVVTIVLAHFLRLRIRLAHHTPEGAAENLHVAAQTALRELKLISEKAGGPSEIYAQCIDCLRVYLHERFGVNADEMTTDELKGALQVKTGLPAQRQRELEHLLERADLVKFARFQPRLASAHQFANVAQRWVRTVEQVSVGSKDE